MSSERGEIVRLREELAAARAKCDAAEKKVVALKALYETRPMSAEVAMVASMAAQIAGGMCAYSHPAHRPDVQLTERECDSIATSSVSMARRILAKVEAGDDRPAALPPEGITS